MKRSTLIILIILIVIQACNYTLYIKSDRISIDYKESPIEKNLNIEGSSMWFLNGTGIYINDNDPNYNWSKTTSENEWCTGLGTENIPYVIENVTINANNSGNCIEIRFSSKYFIIRNCTLYNSGPASDEAGIYLYNTENGKIIENNISSNSNGLYFLKFNYNIIVENNIINLNTRNGIYFGSSGNNIIFNNTIRFNGNNGIYLNQYGDFNNFSFNFISDNNQNGILIDKYSGGYMYSNCIFKNNISFNKGRGINCISSLEMKFYNISYNIISNNLEEGIYMIDNADENFIIGNSIFNNGGPGIYLDDSDDNIIKNNNINGNSYGIQLFKSHNNDILENNLSYNEYGIFVYLSNNNLMANNTIYNCKIAAFFHDTNYWCNYTGNKMINCGFHFVNTYDADITTNLDISNLINGKPVYYYVDEKNLRPVNFSNAGQIILINCSDSLIIDLNLTKGTIGIHLYLCNNITISEVDLSDNIMYGLYLRDSNNNKILGNTIKNIKGFRAGTGDDVGGIIMRGSCDYNIISGNQIQNNSKFGLFIFDGITNLIYLNNFTENFNNALDGSLAANQWDNLTIGNYWSDYNGKDANDDGIGDTPYILPPDGGNQDNYPIWWDAPKISINIPIEDQFFGIDSPTFSISIVEGITDTMWYTIDNGKVNITFKGLTGKINQTEWDKKNEEIVNIRFYSNDSHGYECFAEIFIRKELTAPVSSLYFITHSGDNIVNETTLFFISANDINGSGVSIVRYKINDSNWIEYTGPFNLEDYKSGYYLISYQAIDNVGNIEAENTLLIELMVTSKPQQPEIPGYNLFILIGIICIISKILIKKRFKS